MHAVQCYTAAIKLIKTCYKDAFIGLFLLERLLYLTGPLVSIFSWIAA